VRRWEAAQLSGDWDAVAALMSEDCVIREAQSLPYGGVRVGRERAIDVIKTVFATYEMLDIDFSWLLSGDVVINRVSGRARVKATGREVAIDGVELVTVRDGLVVDIDVYYRDTVQFVSAMQPA
jgi:ketosteroid isomerase-like protein